MWVAVLQEEQADEDLILHKDALTSSMVVMFNYSLYKISIGANRYGGTGFLERLSFLLGAARNPIHG